MKKEFDQAELNQRIENIIRIGTIHEVDPATAKARVESGDNLSDWLPWIVQRAGDDRSWWCPSVNEQVVILSPSGDMAQGIILPAIYQAAYSAPSDNPEVKKTIFSDGTEITLNKEGKKLEITISGGDGEIVVNAKKVIVNCNDINLGGEGGKKVARIGDRVQVGSGSSAGQWPIIEGSNKVRAT